MRFFALLFFLIAMAVTPTQARNMYESLVYLKSTNAQGKESTLSIEKARRRAFVQVLVRLTGDLEVGYFEEVESIPDDYINESIIKSISGNNNRNAYRIYAFNPPKVNVVIERLKKIIWPMPRPTLVLFLRMHNDEGRLVLVNGKQISSDISEVFLEAEYERGVPINFLATSEIYRSYVNKKIVPGKTAFARAVFNKYRTRYLSIADITENSDGFSVRVDNQFKGKKLFIKTTGEDLLALLRQVANEIIDQIYWSDIQEFQKTNSKDFIIKNINNYQALQTVIAGIKETRGFLSLNPVQITNKDFTYHIEFRGSSDFFSANLDKLSILKRLSSEETHKYLQKIPRLKTEEAPEPEPSTLDENRSAVGSVSVERAREIVFNYLTKEDQAKATATSSPFFSKGN